MKIAIGSENRTKVHAVETVFSNEDMVVTTVNVPSDVAEQPMSDGETLQGAKNRARHALEKGKADVGIGLEGGVIDTNEGMYLCNWGALVDQSGIIVAAGGARIMLPEEVAEGVRAGKELAQVMDAYTKLHDVRSKQGAVGIFTDGYIDRSEMFIHVVKLLAGQYSYQLKTKGLRK
ncbi:DUF84 family protein [Bacillus tianshenii]|nr:DUF84 family protein [Bacillus tianshenii]